MPKLHNKQLTLGGLIDGLDMVRKKDASVMFDFGGLAPTDLDSYRGFYEDLALGFSQGPGYGSIDVATLLKRLKDCVNARFEGYKGGTYRMTMDTALWVANHGETSETIVIDVLDRGYCAILRTDYAET